jgi:hypothetical protein
MSMRIRFKHSRQGIHEVLVSTEMQELLLAKVEAVAEAVRSAGIRVDDVPGDIDLPVRAFVSGRGIRARGYVELNHPSGLAVESKHRILAASLDAARSVP